MSSQPAVSYAPIFTPPDYGLVCTKATCSLGGRDRPISLRKLSPRLRHALNEIASLAIWGRNGDPDQGLKIKVTQAGAEVSSSCFGLCKRTTHFYGAIAIQGEEFTELSLTKDVIEIANLYFKNLPSEATLDFFFQKS